MNRYASGYTLCSLLSIFGFAAIALSTICSFFFIYMYVSIDIPGGEFLLGIAFVILIFGFFQGITSLGMGAIGRAILDGSVAQQEISENLFANLDGNLIKSGHEATSSKQVPYSNKPYLRESADIDFSKIRPMKPPEN